MRESHLTWSDLERPKLRSPRLFRSFVSCKEAELGHMLLLNINRKAYNVYRYGESTYTSYHI